MNEIRVKRMLLAGLAMLVVWVAVEVLVEQVIARILFQKKGARHPGIRVSTTRWRHSLRSCGQGVHSGRGTPRRHGVAGYHDSRTRSRPAPLFQDRPQAP